jgi:hypothetical protein
LTAVAFMNVNRHLGILLRDADLRAAIAASHQRRWHLVCHMPILCRIAKDVRYRFSCATGKSRSRVMCYIRSNARAQFGRPLVIKSLYQLGARPSVCCTTHLQWVKGAIEWGHHRPLVGKV